VTDVRWPGLALAVCLLAAGCGPNDRVKPEDIPIKEDTALKRATLLLESYAKGQAVGSESTSFEFMVTEVRKEDPTRADILKKGFDELQKTKGAATAAKAKEILNKLGPKPNPD
jgi:hypothetical protein